MINIELSYRPIPFLKYERHIKTYLPARWSEMTAEQFALIPSLQSGGLTESRILEVFLSIKRRIAKRISTTQAYWLTRNLKYLSRPEPLSVFIIKDIAGLRAPGPKMKGVTFGAFIFGETFFSNYLTGEEEDLDRFIACYYTGSNGFNDKDIDSHACLIAQQNIETRQAIALNYRLIRDWLALAYPNVFQKAPIVPANKTTGWVDVFDNLVYDDLGNQDKYLQTPVSTILRNLNNKLKGRK